MIAIVPRPMTPAGWPPLARLLGRISFSVLVDDAGRLEIHSLRELEPDVERLASRMTGMEQAVVKDATDKAASLSGKVLNYIAHPTKRILTNRKYQ